MLAPTEIMYTDTMGNTIKASDNAARFVLERPDNRTLARVEFQQGTVSPCGLNGVTNEQLLAILIHRTLYLDSLVPCNENKIAITSMRNALAAFDLRAAHRAENSRTQDSKND